MCEIKCCSEALEATYRLEKSRSEGLALRLKDERALSERLRDENERLRVANEAHQEAARARDGMSYDSLLLALKNQKGHSEVLFAEVNKLKEILATKSWNAVLAQKALQGELSEYTPPVTNSYSEPL